MKYVISTMLVLSLSACPAIPKNAGKKIQSVGLASGASGAANSGCQVFDDLKRNGNTYDVNDNTRYWCTDLFDASRHLRFRVFKDNTIARHEIGQAEELFSLYADEDSCYINLQAAGVTKFDFYDQAVDGSNYLIGFHEFKINGSGSEWSCQFEIDSAI